MFKVVPGTITHDGRKVPLFEGWQQAATNDQSVIAKWREEWRDRFSHFAVPTGTVNDILVLDVDLKIDPKTGKNGFDSLRDLPFQLPPTMKQNTINGGIHLIYKYPKDGNHYGNRVKFAPGLDTRGENGYIFWYGLASDSTNYIADAPLGLLELIRKKPTPTSNSPIGVAPDIALKSFNSALRAIESAVEGERNATLNTHAYIIGQLITAGAIQKDVAELEIYRAARSIGLPDHEIKATLKSAFDGGAKHPLTSPFENAPPVSYINLPPPPAAPERWTPKYLTRHDLLNVSQMRKPQLFESWSTEDITITTADGGTGKTTLALQEAICLALGEPYLGFNPRQTGKTLFITGEDTDKKLAAVLGAMLRQMGLFEERIGNEEKVNRILDSIVIKKDSDLCLISRDRQGLLIPNESAFNKILEAVDDIKPKMIVFDPIASFWGSEKDLNDMNRSVIKIMGRLVDRSNACVVMINHMGKASSNSKDMSQFAGRGGTGLPSNSRVSRTMRRVDENEYKELTGNDLLEGESCIMCNVNKFTDGSPLYNKPFLILRQGYLFKRIEMTPQKAKEASDAINDVERVFRFVQEARQNGKYPTLSIIEIHFMNTNDPMSAARAKRAVNWLVYDGLGDKKFQLIEHPDLTIKEKGIVIIETTSGKEII